MLYQEGVVDGDGGGMRGASEGGCFITIIYLMLMRLLLLVGNIFLFLPSSLYRRSNHPALLLHCRPSPYLIQGGGMGVGSTTTGAGDVVMGQLAWTLDLTLMHHGHYDIGMIEMIDR